MKLISSMKYTAKSQRTKKNYNLYILEFWNSVIIMIERESET